MTEHHSILYRFWRIVFFPIVMLCLFIAGGAKALVTWCAFWLIVYGLRNVSLGPSSLSRDHNYKERRLGY
ncbi:MAG: hypothetical protein KGJ66_06250 [Alphaproteobacteria bacterium]|nr:hypothetical protein [Alphaproteobacteria bacterium]